MILQETSARSLSLWGTVLLIGGLIGTLLFLLPPLARNAPPDTLVDPNVIQCGAEHVAFEVPEGETDSVLLMIGEQGARLRNGETQSEEMAHTGTYSCKVDADHNFGMTYVFQDLHPNDRFLISVWQYNVTSFQTSLVTHLTSEEEGYVRHTEVVESKDNGWKRIETRVLVPYTFTGGELRVYVYGYGKGEAYFDDLYIERVRPTDSLELAATLPQIQLEIPEKGLRKLDKKRWEAIHRGLLSQGENDWTKARLHTGEESIPVKLRLKGDLSDHFTGNKWSFRVKTKEPYAWNRLITFSLHTPLARGHLAEWVYHQWLQREDVLSPRYDFAHVQINGETRGLYAWEEHFEKQLVESHARREGPILKFDENGVWEVRQRASDHQLDWGEMERETQSYETSHPQAFKEAKTLEDSLLSQQFQLGNTLLRQFQLGELAASSVFDVESLAKYCAITDLTKAYHGLIWHNLRFYYNPVSSRLEPVGFDGFTEKGAFIWLRRPFMGANIDHSQKGSLADIQLRKLFLDPVIAAKYHEYLEKWTRRGQVEELMMDLDPAINEREKLIRLEFPDYEFHGEGYVSHARKIRQLLFPYNHTSLKAYTRERNTDSLDLAVFNHHLLSLEVLGWGRTTRQMSEAFPHPLFVHAKGREPIREFGLSVPASATCLYYRVPGLDSVYQSRIFEWQPGYETTPEQSLFADVILDRTEVYEVEGSQIRIRPGQHRFTSPLIIPAGYQLNIPAGTEIDLTKKAAIISRSPVYFEGNASKPIILHSSDGSGQGLVVLQAGSESVLDYVEFRGLDNLDIEEWTLTGAVTFYESPVRVTHCLFTENTCEDALNLIRSPFSLQNSGISHTFSDGFDADFCRGELRNCFFSHTGNDGMDFSGSEIQVFDCKVLGAGDKGISVGEQSTVQVWDLEVREAITAAASKDLSTLTIHSIQLEDCQTGFAAYQKKPEFGGGDMIVKKYQAKNIRYLHLIDKGSRLLLRGKEVEGI
ncbi:MAG: CotH kinase family protein [Bacteroidota bacterium]